MRRRFGTRPAPASADESGFTLVELMAALTILAVGIVGTIGVMNSSIRVAGTTGARSKGVAVATKHIERLRAVPYDQLVPAGSSADVTTVSEPIGNRIYTVKWVVTLVDEATPGSTGTPVVKAYKKAFVWVSWTDESGVHDVYQTTFIYPGGRGRHNPTAASSSPDSTNAPDPPINFTAGPVTDSTDVDLAWDPPAPTPTAPAPAAWVVQYSKDSTFPSGSVHQVADSLPAAVTELRVTDLAALTTYHFRIFTKSAEGTLSATAAQRLNVTTNSTTSTSCTVGTASVTPSAVKKKSANDGGGLATNPRVAVTTLGTCVDLSFRMEYSSGNGVTRDVAMLIDATNTYSATVDGTLEWTVGDHDITVFSYSGSTKTVRARLRLTVCAANRRNCS